MQTPDKSRTHAKKTLWIVGVDPGFTETGLVLRASDRPAFDVAGYATYCLGAEKGGWMIPALRAMSLAASIVECMVGWISLYKIGRMEACIEMPVYNGNPKTYMLQSRLIQEIESLMYRALAPALRNFYLTEVNNATSKKLATGDGGAQKPAVVTASPFKDTEGLVKSTREALADAWAHSLVAKQSWNITRSQLMYVPPKVIAPTISWDKLKKELGLDE